MFWLTMLCLVVALIGLLILYAGEKEMMGFTPESSKKAGIPLLAIGLIGAGITYFMQ
jgi:hypothetical protein